MEPGRDSSTDDFIIDPPESLPPLGGRGIHPEHYLWEQKMSTKLYHGRRINTSDFNMVLEILCTFNDQAKPLIEEEYRKRIFKLAVRFFDRKILAGETIQKNFVNEAILEFMNRAEKCKTEDRRDPVTDFSGEVSFFPLQDKFLCYLTAEQDFLHELFSSLDGVEEYAYWNNTDRPERCTKREWIERKKDWSMAFNLMGGMDFSGFIFKLTHVPFFVDSSFYSSDLCSFEERASSFAKEKLVERYFDKEKGLGQVFNLLKTKVDELEEIKKEIRSKLKEVVRLSDLIGSEEDSESSKNKNLSMTS